MKESGGSIPSVVTGALLGGGEGNNSNSSGSTTKAVVTAGLSFFILRFVASAAKAAAEESRDGKSLNDKSEVFYQFVRSVVRKMILQSRDKLGMGPEGSSDEDSDSEEEENVPMIHQGSCHCRAVCFELIAPTKILCQESQTGKIQYRHARIRAKSFRFIKGAHLVSMYYVNKSPTQHDSRTNEEVGAHSFCSRCGVHFLHAPNSRSTALDVNVDCLNPKDAKIKSAKGKRVINLSAGVPVSDQWEQDAEVTRYPATIAEETSPNSPMPFDKSSPFAAYKHHPLMRPYNQQDWDPQDYNTNTDDSTIDLVFPDATDKAEPDTPSTVYTTLTEPSGVPIPTLTLDTSRRQSDADSIISMNSTRSGYPPLAPSSSSLRASSPADSFGGMSSPDHHQVQGISPSTTPLVRHQMNFYMRKHMSSGGSSMSSSTPGLRISPNATVRPESIP